MSRYYKGQSKKRQINKGYRTKGIDITKAEYIEGRPTKRNTKMVRHDKGQTKQKLDEQRAYHQRVDKTKFKPKKGIYMNKDRQNKG